MGDQREQALEEQRIKLAEELWLNYFNRVLLEQSIITQAEHNRMTALIAIRSSQKTQHRKNEIRQKN